MKLIYFVIISFILGSVFGYFSHEAKLEKERYDQCNKDIESRFRLMEYPTISQDNKTISLIHSGGTNGTR